MMTTIVGAETVQMHETARAMARSHDNLSALLSQARSGMEQLQSSAWSGRHRVQAESHWSTLLGGLDPASEQMVQLARGLERVASALDQAGAFFGIHGSEPVVTACEDTTPPPRIYIINGIDSQTRPGSGDDNTMSKELKELLHSRGYSGENIGDIDPIYHAPFQEKEIDKQKEFIDNTLQPIMPFLPMVTALGLNSAYVVARAAAHPASQAYGATEVMNEYVQKEKGRYSQQVLNQIKKDIEDGKLKKGQKIMLVGHSGGGAVACNIVQELEKINNERNGGERVEVEGVVTLGSPVANADLAARDTKVLSISHKDEVIGKPYIRSDEGPRTTIRNVIDIASNPLDLSNIRKASFSPFTELTSRDTNANIVYGETNDGVTSEVVDANGNVTQKKVDAHGSYKNSEQMIDLVEDNFFSSVKGFKKSNH